MSEELKACDNSRPLKQWLDRDIADELFRSAHRLDELGATAVACRVREAAHRLSDENRRTPSVSVEELEKVMGMECRSPLTLLMLLRDLIQRHKEGDHQN